MAELHEFNLIYVLVKVELDLVLKENIIEGLIFRFDCYEKGISINKEIQIVYLSWGHWVAKLNKKILDVLSELPFDISKLDLILI